MIKVKYDYQDGRYCSLDVKGHALSAAKGQDLICASVSSIMFGLMNGLDNLNDQDIIIKQLDNEIVIKCESDNEIANNYLELVIIQLKTIEESYGDFIKVERK